MRVRADRATDSTCGAQRRPERWAKAEPYGRCHAEARKLRAPYALGVQRTPNIWRTDGSVDLEALVGVLGTLQLLKRHELTGQTGLLPALTAARRYELAGLLGEQGEISYPARGVRLPELVGELESIALTYGVDLPSLLGELGELATTRRYDLDALLGETPEITVENEEPSNGLLTGCVHGWPLTETSGNRADIIGSLTLSEVGGTISSDTGKFTTAADFTGSNYMASSVNSPADWSDGVTVSLWVKEPAWSGVDFDWVACAPAASYMAGSWRLWIQSSNNLRMSIQDSSRFQLTQNKNATFPAENTNWRHIVARIDRTALPKTIDIWIDGSLWGTTTYTANGTVASNAHPMTIGADGAIAKICEVAVWNRKLSDAEVALLWNSGSGLPITAFD